MTALNIYDLWQTLLTEVNVSQNGQIPPTTFQNWVNEVNVEMFRDKFSSYELIQQVNDEIKLPFLTTVSIPVVGGYIAYPANYEYFSSAKIIRQKDIQKCINQDPLPEINTDGKCAKYTDPDYAAMAVKFATDNLITNEVQLIDNQRWTAALGHATKCPTYDNPKITQYSGGFKVAPTGIQLAILDYLHTPRAAVFGYTISVDDILIYSAGSSTQLEWSNILKSEFIARLAKKYAKYIQSAEVFQMSENERKTN